MSFDCDHVIMDPEKELIELNNMIPGVRIDAVDTGDHLHLVDAAIRRLKKMRRFVVS